MYLVSKTGVLVSAIVIITLVSVRAEGQEIPPRKTEDPNNVPTEISLYQPAPVLRAIFRVTPEGYELLSTERVMGASTSSVIKSRPVKISALGAEGDTVGTVTKLDPLQVHTTGADNPEQARLAEAQMVVFFMNPDAIQTLEVQVRQNQDVAYRQRFNIEQ